MKITWKNIKDYVYIGAMIIGALLWWRDEVKEDAVNAAALTELKNDVSEIKSTQQVKFGIYDTYWIEQTKSMATVTAILGVSSE